MKSLDLAPSKKFFRPDEVAQFLALSRRTIYRMMRDGRLPSFRPGGSGAWRIPRQALADLVAGAVAYV